MDHKTRVWNALSFKPADRVPFDMFDEAGYLFDGNRYDPAQRLRLPMEEQVAARIRFHQEFDTDLIFDAPVVAQGQVPYTLRLTPRYAERYELLSGVFPMIGGVWHPWPPNIKPKQGIDTSDDDGVEVVVEWRNGLSVVLSIEVASGTTAGYEVLMKGREEWSLWQEAYAPLVSAFDYRYVDQILAATHGDVALYGTILGPYSMFQTFFGIEESTILLYEQPELAGEVMDWLTDVAIEAGRDMIRHDVDILRVGEAAVSLLSPRFYRKHVLRCHRRLNDALKRAGGMSILHVCGRCSTLLEAIADAGTVGLEPLTPPPLADADLAAAKRHIGDRVCLKGNLDPVHVVVRLSPEEVGAETRRCLEIGSPGGGYILSVADCMVPGTPIENMRAIAEAVHDFRPL